MPFDNVYGGIDTDAPQKLAALISPETLRAKRLQQLQQEEAVQGIEDARSLRELLKGAGTTDPAVLAQKAMGAGNMSAAQAFQKQAAEQRKAQQEGQLNDAKIKEAHYKIMESEAGFAYADPSNANMTKFLQARGVPQEQWGAALAALPADAEGRRNMFRQTFTSWKDRGPQLQNVNGQLVDVNDPANKGRVIPQQIGPEYEVGADGKVTGMNPGVLRAKTQIAQAGANAGGVPMTILQTENGVVQVPTRGGGGAVPVIDPTTGKQAKAPASAGGNATEGERTAATLLSRLESSQKQLDRAVQENPSSASPNVTASVLGKVPLVGEVASNLANPQTRQRVEAAQLDILDAALTLGTGAAYTKEQLTGYRKAYFPQIGDDPKTVADKQDRLDSIITAAKIKAGRAAPKGGEVSQPAAGAPPSIPAGWSVKAK